jgi:hypothetical protein
MRSPPREAYLTGYYPGRRAAASRRLGDHGQSVPVLGQPSLTSMVSNADDMSICVTRPVSAMILLLSALMVLWPIWKPGAAVVD